MLKSKADIFQELTIIFRDVFDDENIVINESTSAKDIALWDSLNHINMVIAAEQKFGVKFRAAEVARLANVGEFVDTVINKLAAASLATHSA